MHSIWGKFGQNVLHDLVCGDPKLDRSDDRIPVIGGDDYFLFAYGMIWDRTTFYSFFSYLN